MESILIYYQFLTHKNILQCCLWYQFSAKFCISAIFIKHYLILSYKQASFDPKSINWTDCLCGAVVDSHQECQCHQFSFETTCLQSVTFNFITKDVHIWLYALFIITRWPIFFIVFSLHLYLNLISYGDI